MFELIHVRISINSIGRRKQPGTKKKIGKDSQGKFAEIAYDAAVEMLPVRGNLIFCEYIEMQRKGVLTHRGRRNKGFIRENKNKTKTEVDLKIKPKVISQKT